MYIDLNAKWLKENWDRLLKAAVDEFGEEDGEDLLHDQEVKHTAESLEFSDGVLNVSVDSDFGYVGLEIEIPDDLIFEMVDHIKEKGNKYKEYLKFADWR